MSDMTLKLADFGLAIDLRRERAVTRAGTLDYMAPEGIWAGLDWPLGWVTICLSI